MDAVKLLVRVSDQTATLFVNGAEQKKYIISTGERGTGCEAESFKTPLGRLRVSEKFGDGMALGTVFVDRIPTGVVWNGSQEGDNLILTRILWLEGLDPENANTKDRYIYLHGTKNEHRLGTPASSGCIVFANKDIVDVFDRMPVGADVEVVI